MKAIILASASPRRAELLRQLGFSFTVVKSGVAEDELDHCEPYQMAERLALAKARAVAAGVTDALVIGADTIVCVDGRVLGKPRDRYEAVDMLRLLAGREHHVLTGLALIGQPENRVLTHVETTRVFMRELKEEEISWYTDSGEPYDKAGGYGIQGKAAVFVERLDGCYFNVVGLPLAALWQLFGSFGIRIWEGAGIYDIQAPDHQGFASE
ncbi:MAG: septum formation inhibitor Maf [Dethiobacter sp.]|nr:septum formation inhibitor Maf [Dethiobacter sp.]